mmetsp:Transcript_25504/g.81608  ORF Transcript_25504/g.81608 Transcript_25504/m.81608 type:complete len:359 (-) Transcript_25504:1648-2724(-)
MPGGASSAVPPTARRPSGRGAAVASSLRLPKGPRAAHTPPRLPRGCCLHRESVVGGGDLVHNDLRESRQRRRRRQALRRERRGDDVCVLELDAIDTLADDDPRGRLACAGHDTHATGPAPVVSNHSHAAAAPRRVRKHRRGRIKLLLRRERLGRRNLRRRRRLRLRRLRRQRLRLRRRPLLRRRLGRRGRLRRPPLLLFLGARLGEERRLRACAPAAGERLDGGGAPRLLGRELGLQQPERAVPQEGLCVAELPHVTREPLQHRLRPLLGGQARGLRRDPHHRRPAQGPDLGEVGADGEALAPDADRLQDAERVQLRQHEGGVEVAAGLRAVRLKAAHEVRRAALERLEEGVGLAGEG